MNYAYATASAVALSVMAVPAQAALVVNGDFQTGNFTGWTVSSDEDSNASVQMPFDGEEGDYRAVFVGSGVSDLAQTFATVAGSQYRLTFDALVDFPFARMAAPPAPGEVRMLVTIDGQEVEVPSDTGGGLTNYALDFTGSGASRLLFQIAAGPGRWQLDNVIVTPTVAAVPEPATWAMMLTGFGIAGLSLRSRRRVATDGYAGAHRQGA